MSFFRYPGGKAKFCHKIIDSIPVGLGGDIQYREPFFGGGGIGLKLFTANPLVSDMWINDKDVGIVCLWTSVAKHQNALRERILAFKPEVDDFYRIKTELLAINTMPDNDADVIDVGFKKLVIHQISYSGLGTKSGGPLGGLDQKSQYKIDCRWSPNYICKKLAKVNEQLNSIKFTCTNLDFVDLIDAPGKCMLYLDPPYYIKGSELYQHSFTHCDHQRLAHALSKTKHPWVLSYDDCPEIRSLYAWADVKTFDAKYTITGTKNKATGERSSLKKNELLILPLRG